MNKPPDTIHLGYALGTGEPVGIPVAHMAVTGQTQASGKTTTLEALVQRSGRRAVTFITKRGEGAFAAGRRIQPYFRDRADWQFVSSIIDANLQEKNKFLRPWIIKICRTTKTLKEVHREVQKAMVTAKGINEGVYTQLDAYLEMIVPEIERAELAPTLDLRDGLNVMDVSGFDTTMQMLFVQSALDWINEHERDTIVVIPEAWEFIPQGKSSPVKNAAVTLVRKGAGLGNFIWVDSQDMAGVDKVILRGCTTWIIGVQRESNEISRTLANIPAGIAKPKPENIALLEKGQFYACWGRHAIKTYVQPAWMKEAQARDIAAHGLPPGVQPLNGVKPPRNASVRLEAGYGVELRQREKQGPVEVVIVNPVNTLHDMGSTKRIVQPSLAPRTFMLNEQHETHVPKKHNPRVVAVSTPRDSESPYEKLFNPATDEDENMDDKQIEKLGKVIADAMGPVVAKALKQVTHSGDTAPSPAAYGLKDTAKATGGNPDMCVPMSDEWYEALRTRLMQDPTVIEVLQETPRIEVSVSTKKLQVNSDTPDGRLALLIRDGFLDDGRKTSGIVAEMNRTGKKTNNINMAGTLKKFVHMGFLTREGDAFKAVASLKKNLVRKEVNDE